MQQVKVTDDLITYIKILRQRYLIIVVNMIWIGHITSYLAHNVHHIIHSFVLVVDIICIGIVMSYLYHNIARIHTILLIFSSSVNDWCIISFPICNLICFSIPSSFLFFRFASEYDLNPNPIRIYVTPFITSTKANFDFLIFWNYFWFCVV